MTDETLWPHQETAVRATIDAMNAGQGRGLWVFPTGSGKTRAFTSLARRLGLDTLTVVHRDVIQRQAAEEFRRSWPGVKVGTLPGDHGPDDRVLVATVQSLGRRLDDYPRDRFGLVIVDEAHHAVAPMWEKVLAHFRPRFLLGVTATPKRLDGKSVEDVFGRVLHAYPLDRAIDDGRLVPVRQSVIRTETDLSEVGSGRGDFSLRPLARAVSTDERNRLVVEGYLEQAEDRPALFFGTDVTHASSLQKALVARGVRAAVVTGKTGEKDRLKILAGFRGGDLDALVGIDVLTEGYDEARVGCVVMARPTQSEALYTQCVGRGLRRSRGGDKEDCLVLDVVDAPSGVEVVTASRLFGGFGVDCGGRDVRLAVAEERARWGLEPLRPTASQLRRWHLGEDTQWDEMPSLRGYRPPAWDARTATAPQIKLLAGFGFVPCRELTKGEASHLIQECQRLDRRYFTPPTPATAWKLRANGINPAGMTKREANREVGRVMAKAR